MGYSIDPAWRVPAGRFLEALDILHDLMWDRIKGHVTRILEAFKGGAFWEQSKDEMWGGALSAVILLRKVLRVTKDLSTRTYLDMECGYAIWANGDWFYFIPIGPWAAFPLKEDIPDWIEDYHWQNKTDTPEEFTEEEYAARGKKWREVAIGEKEERADWHTRQLWHQVFGLINDGPWDERAMYMLREIGEGKLGE